MEEDDRRLEGFSAGLAVSIALLVMELDKNKFISKTEYTTVLYRTLAKRLASDGNIYIDAPLKHIIHILETEI